MTIKIAVKNAAHIDPSSGGLPELPNVGAALADDPANQVLRHHHLVVLLDTVLLLCNEE